MTSLSIILLANQSSKVKRRRQFPSYCVKMALNKSPSTTHPSCSVSSNRPVSSVEKLIMRTKIKTAKIERSNSQPLKPSHIPTPVIKPERPASVPHMDVLSSSTNTNTQRTSCAAHTRPWRPSSVLPQHVQSENHLPNPRIAKLLDRGWKSASILPSYPQAGPERYTASRPSSTVKYTATDTSSTNNSTRNHSSYSWEDNVIYATSSGDLKSPRMCRKICCIPIPVYRKRSNLISAESSDTHSARQQGSASRRDETSTSSTGVTAQVQHSRIPVPRSITPQVGFINKLKPRYVDSRKLSAKSAPIRRTSKIPVLSNRSVISLAQTSLEVPSLKFFTEEVVNEYSPKREIKLQKPQKVPSLQYLAEQAVEINIDVPREQKVPSLKYLTEQAVEENSIKQNIDVPRAQKVPSLKCLAEQAVKENGLKQNIDVPIVQKVPSLKYLSEQAVKENGLKQNIDAPRAQKVPSLKYLAEHAVEENSTKQNIDVPIAQKVPSLKYLADHAVEKNSIKQNIDVPREQKVPSLKYLAEEAVKENGLKQNIDAPRTQNVPSLKYLAKHAVEKNSIKQNIDVPRDQKVPSLKYLSEQAIKENGLKQNIDAPRAHKVPSLKYLAEHAVEENSIKQNIDVPIAQKVPSLKYLAEHAVEENSIKQNIDVPRAQNVPSLIYLAKQAVEVNVLKHNIDVPKAQKVPSLTYLAEQDVEENGLKHNIDVPRAHIVPKPKYLTDKAVEKSALKQNIDVSKAQKVPNPKYLIEESALKQNIDVPRTQNVPSLKYLAGQAADKYHLKQDIDVSTALKVPNLEYLTEQAAIEENGLKQKIESKKAQEVQNLSIFAGKDVDKMGIKQNMDSPRTQNVPSLRFLAEKAASEDVFKQKIDVPRIKIAESPNLVEENMIAGNNLLNDTGVHKTCLDNLLQHAHYEHNLERDKVLKIQDGARARSVLCNRMSNIPVSRISRTSESKRQTSCCSTRRSRPPTRASEKSRVTKGCEGTKFEYADKTDDKGDWNYYSTERTVQKKVEEAPDGVKKQLDETFTLETYTPAPVAWESDSCIVDESNEMQKYEPVDLDRYFKNHKVKEKFPTLSELAERAVRKYELLEICERGFENPKISMVRTGSPEMETDYPDECRYTDERFTEVDHVVAAFANNTNKPIPLSRDPCSQRAVRSVTPESSNIENDPSYQHRAYQMQKPPEPPDGVNTGSKSRSSSASSVRSNLPVSAEKERDSRKTSGSRSREEKTTLPSGKCTKTTGTCEHEHNVKKIPRLKPKKKTESVADKVDNQKLQRLKHDHDNISNSDVFKMITAIHEEDKEAAKMLEELKLITKLEEEQENKIMKSKLEEARLVAEIGDFKDKLADTIHKKEKVDAKLLEIYKEELKPDTEFEVIENYLHIENMAKTYHEKRNFEECNIAFLEHELKTEIEQQNLKLLKKTKEPKIKPRMTKNALRLQKEKGLKVRQDKIQKVDEKFKNGGQHSKSKQKGATYFKEPENNNFNPLLLGMKEIPNSHEKTDKINSRRMEKKPNDTAMPTKNAATRTNKTLPINKNKINAAIKTSNQQTKRQFVSKRNEDFKSKQADSHKDNRDVNKTKKSSEKKRDGEMFLGNENKKIDIDKHGVLKNMKNVPNINIPRSKIAPKPKSITSDSAEQGQLKMKGRKSKHNTQSKVMGNTMKPVDRSKGVVNSNVQGTSAIRVHTQLDKSDNNRKNLHNGILKRPIMEPNKLRQVVQPKAKPGYINTQLPSLKNRTQSEAKQPKAPGTLGDKRRVPLPKMSKQSTKVVRDRHEKGITEISKPDFVF
ncbi:uncharacterized protein LOC123534714 [Mercenaria mercenaria]|uniref:uncharacterized protein LOC123534714 n=1 Tax=Mercenaria mercenaria TaxID=6596 RepID=UPI00234E453A|nr:uncharacterized protein LOC123534714 [Mercenaria mercenaria]